MRKFLWISAGTIVTVVVILALALTFLDEPFRRYAEQQINRHLKGYSVALGALHVHPIGLSVEFQNLTLRQTEHPEPPVASIPFWRASIHWRALLHGQLVSDHVIDRPTVHVTLAHVKQEATDKEAFTDRGWQDAILSVYPLRINVVHVTEADVTYLDNPRSKPLHLSHLNFDADNIRNVRSRDRTYPSSLRLDGQVLDSGHMTLDGAADFLAEPHLGIKADLVLDKITLDDVLPVTGRVNVQLRKGVLSARGQIEYSPVIKIAKLNDLRVEGMRLDYVHAAQTAVSEEKVAAATADAAKTMSNHPEWLIRIDQAKFLDSELGFVNHATTPHYRVFLTDASIAMENFSNQLTEGTAFVKVAGKFMGSGLAQANGTFRPEQATPDFTLQVRLLKTKLRSLNALLRAHGDFDVTDGVLSFFSELTVKDGHLNGYVKPFFKDVAVYDPEQDRDKSVIQKLYEGVVGDTVTALANLPRNEVATKADISGPVGHPRTNTWEAVAKLMQNAFFKAILPGLEKEMTLHPRHG